MSAMFVYISLHTHAGLLRLSIGVVLGIPTRSPRFVRWALCVGMALNNTEKFILFYEHFHIIKNLFRIN
jgi:hypothetical protein